MIKQVGKAALRLSRACSAFVQTLKAGGVNTIALNQIQNHDALSGKRIVITGGGSGIGFAIAKQCVESGATVLITGRNEKKLKTAAAKLDEKRMRYLVWDIADSSQADAKVAQCVDLLDGHVDAVIMNGIGYTRPTAAVRSLSLRLFANIGWNTLHIPTVISSISLHREDSSAPSTLIACPNGTYAA